MPESTFWVHAHHGHCLVRRLAFPVMPDGLLAEHPDIARDAPGCEPSALIPEHGIAPDEPGVNVRFGAASDVPHGQHQSDLSGSPGQVTTMFVGRHSSRVAPSSQTHGLVLRSG
jgi:hypothetical protein